MRSPAFFFLALTLGTFATVPIPIPAHADAAVINRIADWALGQFGRRVLTEFAEGQLVARYFRLAGDREAIGRGLAGIPEIQLRLLDARITRLGIEISRGARLQPSVSTLLFTRETGTGVEFVPFEGWGERTFSRQHYTEVLRKMNAATIEALDPAKASTPFLRSRLLGLSRYFAPDGGPWQEIAVKLLRDRLVLIQVDGDPVIRIAIDDFVFTFREFEALLADELRLAAAYGARSLRMSYLTHPRLWMPAPSGWAASRAAFLEGDLRSVPQSVFDLMAEDQARTRFQFWVWERDPF